MTNLEELEKTLAEQDYLFAKKNMKVIVGCNAANMHDVVYLLQQHAFPSRYIAFATDDDPAGP